MDVVIVDAVRTPTGKRNGVLAAVHPADLSGMVLSALQQRNDFDPSIVDDVIWGCVTQTSEQAVNVGRNAVLAAEWPVEVPATTIDRQCGSSQQAIQFAAAGVAAGHYDVVIAGGVESMSRVPMLVTLDNGPGQPYSARIERRLGATYPNQGMSAELVAERYGITRETADELALHSHRRATRASDSGWFENEIVPVDVETSDGVSTVRNDQGIRRDASSEAMAKLKPAFIEHGVVTAGNASQISDGAAAVLITSATTAERHGWRPVARFAGFSVSGVDPIEMLTGPIPATAKVLSKCGLGPGDIDAFEVNEAFAPVVGAWMTAFDVDPDRVNPNGGAIAIGHPLGGSGARLMTTLVHHLQRTRQRYGLQTMCEAGGLANATVIECL
jgi:acetyl-CoA acyltransferase